MTDVVETLTVRELLSVLVPLVADVLEKMLTPGGEAWIADPYRVAAEGFADEVALRGLNCIKEPIVAHSDDLGPLRGTLHKVSRR